MKRTNLESLVIFKSLAVMHEYSEITEHVVGTDDVDGTKNVCFRITSPLFDRLEGMTKILGIPKRKFLEALLIDGLNATEKTMKEEGVFDYLLEMSDPLNEADKAVAEGESA